MTVFVDTSALYAILDRDDAGHERAARWWRHLLEEGIPLVTHNYVVLEATALVQRRLGMEGVMSLSEGLLPVIGVEFVDADLHREATTALLAADRRDLSLVDWASFLLMRRRRWARALALDSDFVDRGFETVGG